MASIGKSITIKGDLSGNEDVQVEGTVEGRVDLPNNEITIGTDGHVSAEVHAKTVTVIGRVTGNVTAVDRIEIQDSGQVDGDVRAPKLVVHEGAVVNGKIEMTGKAPAAATTKPSASPTSTTPSLGATSSSSAAVEG
jgi:cytoskeletal protein CcmA (bactofilin family)